jgi:hypothetical protein
VIVGLTALGALAYAAGSRKVQRLERRLGIAHLMTTGLPFALLGLIASQPQVDILTESVLQEIAPLLPLGLGWIGFVIGARFEAARFKDLPAGTGLSVFILTMVPAALLAAAVVYTISGLRNQAITAQGVRDSLLLATAGVMAARRTPEFARALLHDEQVRDRIRWIVDLEQLAGVFGLMFISAFFRPSAPLVAWVLPGTGWLFVTLGIGTAIGILLYATFSQIQRGPQFAAILLGSVAFTAGIASYLRLSSLAVCFIAGAIFINLGGRWTDAIRGVLERMERPVYFLFLIIGGALWRPGEWQGWALMAVFVAVRFLSKWIAVKLLRGFLVADLRLPERQTIIVAPMGALSVAIVISAQDLYGGATDPAIVTAVLGGALIAEILIRLAARDAGRAGSESGPEVKTGSPYEVH